MVTPELKTAFEREGFAIARRVVPPGQVVALRRAFQELLTKWARECEVTVDEYERVVSQWTGVHEQHPVFARQLQHPAVAQIARELLGVDQLQLFHDHLISKPPTNSHTIPWHQDFPFWPVDKPTALSCWLALDDVDDLSGAMRFMPGAHREGEKAPADFLRKRKDWGPREAEAAPTTLNAGDCVFHSCLSWHTSPPNRSDRPRRAFITILMSAECRWDPEHADWHPMNDCVTVAPGEQFNTDRFPLIDPTGAASC